MLSEDSDEMHGQSLQIPTWPLRNRLELSLHSCSAIFFHLFDGAENHSFLSCGVFDKTLQSRQLHRIDGLGSIAFLCIIGTLQILYLKKVKKWCFYNELLLVIDS